MVTTATIDMPRARAPSTTPVRAHPVVDAGAPFDVTPPEAHPQPPRTGGGHEIEVRFDIRRRLAPDELVAVREAGPRAR